MSMKTLDPRSLQPGDVVAVWVFLVKHVGIVSDLCDQYGLPYVISCSARIGRGAEEPWSIFTGGRIAHKVQLSSRFAAYQVVARARSMLSKPWDIFNWNCEHFVRVSYGLKPESVQLQVVSTAALAITVGLLCGR